MTKISAADAKALVRAIELGLVDKVKALAAKGDVDVTVLVTHGRKTTPLFVAAQKGHAEIVQLLLAAGGTVGGVDDHGGSMLHNVRDVATAIQLLDAGADVHACDTRGQTPLHAAVYARDPALLRLLVERGADVDAKNGEGKTPFIIAQDLEVRRTLKTLGAKGLENTEGAPLSPTKRAAKPDDIAGGALAADGEGNVWIGTKRAILCWDGKAVTAFEFDESFSVSEIAVGAGGQLFVSTNWGLVVKSGDAWRLYNTATSNIPDNHLTDMVLDREGRPCVMGYSSGKKVDRPIAVFDGKDFAIWTAGADFTAGLETNRIAFDGKNRIILGTRSGIVFADGTTWKAPGAISILGSINVLVADGDAVWAGAAGAIHRVTDDAKAMRSIKTPHRANCILVDGDTTWIGLSYGGLLRVRGDEQKLFVGKESGLEGDDVDALALGTDGTLWVSANDKLYQCRGDVLAGFGAKAAAPIKPAKKKKLTPIPAKPLVPAKKMAPHVVEAIESAKLEGLTSTLLLRLVRPAIGIVVAKTASAVAVGGSKLGGRPDLAPGTKWPTYRGERDRFLPFLFQIDLAEVAALDAEGLLPKKGRLSFFCDTQPDEIEDSRVLFDDGKKKPTRAAWPEDLVDRKDEDDFVAQLPEHELGFYPTWTLPSAEYLEKHAELTEADRDALQKLETKLHALDPKKSSTTRLLGWPDTMQGEIVASPERIILLQIDGDMKGPKKLVELLSYWGNGIAHYVIKQTDLEARKLDKAGAELAYT